MPIAIRAAFPLGAAASPAGAPDQEPASHPWIERDPRSGACNLKMPLPPLETARQIAEALALMAQALRGRGG